ncbi:LOW QUALITY PROTEIN: selection and upkeep of intraepithelial T-cells protein 8-like [Trichechus inunguis]
MTSTSEKLMVTSPTRHSMATVGGQAELSCQQSPPQSAEHVEVLSFWGDHSKTVYPYSGGHEMNREASPEYMGSTEVLKEALGEGKVTLRIHNISVYDEGQYQCSFKDSGFYDVANMNLKVTALGLEMQIYVQASGADLKMECNSGGWYPQPQMERDNRGERVPHSSISYSQDKARLFHMKMTLLLRNKSQGNMICYICNPLPYERKRTNIILAASSTVRIRVPQYDEGKCRSQAGSRVLEWEEPWEELNPVSRGGNYSCQSEKPQRLDDYL